MTAGDWGDTGRRAFGWSIAPEDGDGPQFLLYVNAHDFDLIATPPERRWEVVLDSSGDSASRATKVDFDALPLPGRSFILLRS
jgi:hypothetical protein